jgi:hypothetical protein
VNNNVPVSSRSGVGITSMRIVCLRGAVPFPGVADATVTKRFTKIFP